MNKKIKQLVLGLGVAAALAGCAGQGDSASKSTTVSQPSTTSKSTTTSKSATASQTKSTSTSKSSTTVEKKAYISISAQEAKQLMDSEKNYVLLDVRTQGEYDEGHIPGALLLPHEQVADKAEELLQDKDQLILVYCRSGNRSKVASQALSDLGYTQVREMGGINDWPYEIEK